MTDNEFRDFAVNAFMTVKKRSPYRTGWLRNCAIRLYKISNKEYIIILHKDIAYYIVYTNEPWISSKWRGRKNPNEGWIQSAVSSFVKDTVIELTKQLNSPSEKKSNMENLNKVNKIDSLSITIEKSGEEE